MSDPASDDSRKRTTGERIGQVIVWILVAIGVTGALAVALFLGTCFLMTT